MLYTGYRISEALSLRVSQVYDGQAMRPEVWVPRTKMKGKKEGRGVLLNVKLRAPLLAWIEGLHERGWYDLDAPLFPSVPGKAMHRITAWRRFKAAFRSSALPGIELRGRLSCHATRKTFAKGVYEASKQNVLAVQKALRHKEITSTQAYLEFPDDRLDAIILGL